MAAASGPVRAGNEGNVFMTERFTVAAVQGTPAFLDAAATTDRIVAAIAEAAGAGASLVVFPEAGHSLNDFMALYWETTHSWLDALREEWTSGN